MHDLLKLLAGDWVGSGFGEYPTIESFEYQETLRFTADETRPMLHYEQKTNRRNVWKTEFLPSHWETGFLELVAEDQVEVANVQGGGRVEVLEGSAESVSGGFVLRLRSTHLGNDPNMLETTRMISIDGDTLHYVMHMKTIKVPQLALHLEATLHRQ